MSRKLIIVSIAAAGAVVLLALGLATPEGADAFRRAVQWLERTSAALISVAVLLGLTLTAGIAATVIGLCAYRSRHRPPKRPKTHD